MSGYGFILPIAGIRRIGAMILLLSAVFSFSATGEAQQEESIGDKLVYEEVQRYMGYEDILYRYLTLPIDTGLNANVQGNFVDIGFILIAFLPLLLLWAARQRPWLFWTLLVAEFLLLMLYLNNSPVLGLENERIPPGEIDSYLETVDSPAGQSAVFNLSTYMHLFAHHLMGEGGQKGQGEVPVSKYITYPLLVLLFGGLLSWLIGRTRNRNFKYRQLLIFTSTFIFLWLLLSGGIVWYGFIALLLLYYFLIRFFTKKARYTLSRKMVSGLFILCCGLSLIAGWNLKYTNLYYAKDDPNLMVDFPVLEYHAGKIEYEELQDRYFQNVSRAMEEINRTGGIVYRAGTMFPYFVERSNRRLFNDNLLGFFAQLEPAFDSKEEIAAALKASGVDYIMVGLNIGAFDQTPDQSLKQRFNEFLAFLYNNEQLQLVATDRITRSRESGRQFYSVFGEVVSPGSYAIYRIK